MRDPGAAPRLVVPEGLVVDENVRERLDRQLRFAPPGVAGIAAELADLEPGASYRVHTEWSSLTAAALRPASSASIRGAVLLRPEVDFAVKGGAVEVAKGSVLVDPGAQVLDPHRAVGSLRPASERGRPPFSRRPVVVFLACSDSSESGSAQSGGAHADWLRRFVNRLVRHEVEARIATPTPADRGVASDVHLTRPCLPCEETIRALAPDVVVTLDAEAAAQVDAWCEGDRSTVVIEFDPTLPEPIELVSWQIGRAAGRLRARIGPWVDVPAFAALVVRLCAGPQPIAPIDRDETAGAKPIVREHWTGRSTAGAHDRCVLITGSLDAAATARIAALADNLEAAGVPMEMTSVGRARCVAGRGARGRPGRARGRGTDHCDRGADRGAARGRVDLGRRPRLPRPRRGRRPHGRGGDPLRDVRSGDLARRRAALGGGRAGPTGSGAAHVAHACARGGVARRPSPSPIPRPC